MACAVRTIDHRLVYDDGAAADVFFVPKDQYGKMCCFRDVQVSLTQW